LRRSNIPYELFRELSIREDTDDANRSEIHRQKFITLLQKSFIWLYASKFGERCVVFLFYDDVYLTCAGKTRMVELRHHRLPATVYVSVFAASAHPQDKDGLYYGIAVIFSIGSGSSCYSSRHRITYTPIYLFYIVVGWRQGK
jgi:hypothetical protein